MRKTFAVVAILAGLAAPLSLVAAARPASGMQHVTITHDGDSFELRPTTSGSIHADRGTVTFCCWISRPIVRAGARLELDNPLMTLTGINGTLRLRNEIAWVDLPGGWSVFTGTWRVIDGTGDYAGLSGHGSATGIKTGGGATRASFFGFLGPR